MNINKHLQDLLRSKKDNRITTRRGIIIDPCMEIKEHKSFNGIIMN